MSLTQKLDKRGCFAKVSFCCYSTVYTFGFYLPRKWLRILSDFGYLSRFERDQKIRQIIYLSVIFACPVGPEDRTGMNSSDHRERARTKL